MRSAWAVTLAVWIPSLASAAAIDPAAAWQPMHPFIGTWKATGDGPVRVTRVVASAPTNRHLEITETSGRSRAVVRGMVSFDPERQVLVLRRFAADGSVSDVAFDSAASIPGKLVFASGASAATRTRVTYERTGAKAFVERIERAAGGEAFALVSETRFVRRD